MIWHDAATTRYAHESRNKLLAFYAAAEEASCLLSHTEYTASTATTMIGAMLGALGAKADNEALAGMNRAD